MNVLLRRLKCTQTTKRSLPYLCVWTGNESWRAQRQQQQPPTPIQLRTESWAHPFSVQTACRRPCHLRRPRRLTSTTPQIQASWRLCYHLRTGHRRRLPCECHLVLRATAATTTTTRRRRRRRRARRGTGSFHKWLRCSSMHPTLHNHHHHISHHHISHHNSHIHIILQQPPHLPPPPPPPPHLPLRSTTAAPTESW